jgi:hypothetical protein
MKNDLYYFDGVLYWKYPFRREAGYVRDGRKYITLKNKEYRYEDVVYYVHFGKTPPLPLKFANGNPLDTRIENIYDIASFESD